MVNFTLNSTTARTANQKTLQRRVDDAHARIIHVTEVIGNNPTAHEFKKVEDLENYADLGEAYIRGDATVPTTARAALGTGTTTPTGTPTGTPATTSNPADQQRITELEAALKDLANMAGVNTIPLVGGKIDIVRLKPTVQTAITNLTATPPAPTNTVAKADVAASATKIKSAVLKLKVSLLKGGRIEGLDILNREVADLDRLAPPAAPARPATP